MKKVICIIFIITSCVILFSGCDDFSSEITTSDVLTTQPSTTEATTLSEEDIERNEIILLQNGIAKQLEEDCECSSVVSLGYIYFQDFVNGAKCRPEDYFFLGTTEDKVAEIENFGFMRNNQILDTLEKYELIDCDYLYKYSAFKKDSYGKKHSNKCILLRRFE